MTIRATTAAATCPKCAHVRGPRETAPAWQCPRCGIAYHKYRAYLQAGAHGARARVAPRQVTDGAPTLAGDTSVWTLLAANVIALVTALVLDWRLVDLLAVYWAQSIIIGCSYYARIVNLDRFSTENFQINNKNVEATEQTKRQTALFFVIHFGGFHLGYLFFIATQTPGGFSPDFGLFACAAAFAVNHRFSYRYHRKLDEAGTPNIGTLMFTPYARIVPMHVTIVCGAIAFNSAGVLLFGLLKTAADILMHLVEHRTLAKPSSGIARSAT